MFILNYQTGEIVNLAHVARVFIDENADGSASVLAAVPISNPKGTMPHINLGKFASTSEAQGYIYDLANQIGAVLPLPDSESKTTEAKQ